MYSYLVSRQWFVLVAALGIAPSGCYRYAVAAREPPPDSQQLSYDRMNPQTSFQWQYFWGLTNEPVWSPLVCNNGEQDSNGRCLKGASDPCHGNGIAFYEVNLPWYSELLKLATVGMVSSVRVTYFCSTEHAAASGSAIRGPQ